MKRLILDHLRRWAWVLALGGALQFGVGMMIANRPDDPHEFWIFLITVWMGAVLLGYDFKNGIIRAVVPLPLTARQIGRAWWLATIPIPAMALAALLFLGAGTFHYFHPDRSFPAGRLALASLLVLPWLGTGFTSIYGMNNEVIFGTWRQKASAFFFSMLAILTLFGGMLTVQNSTKQPVKFAVYMTAATVLIAAGWIRAEGFVLGRVSFRLSALRPKAVRQPMNLAVRPHVPGGYGGIPFLIKTTCVRTFLTLVGMVGLMALISSWRGVGGLGMSREQGVMLLASMGSFMSAFFIFFLQPMPLQGQMRFLRTLPVSAAGLAAVFIGITLLPLIALGAVAAVIAGVSFGTPMALAFLKSFTLILAPAAFCAFLTVWRGGGKQVYAWLLLILFGFLLVPLWLQGFRHHAEISYGQTSALAAFCVLLAFLLTWLALGHGGKAYRPQGGVLPETLG
jgi:hypothetical protein